MATAQDKDLGDLSVGGTKDQNRVMGELDGTSGKLQAKWPGSVSNKKGTLKGFESPTGLGGPHLDVQHTFTVTTGGEVRHRGGHNMAGCGQH